MIYKQVIDLPDEESEDEEEEEEEDKEITR